MRLYVACRFGAYQRVRVFCDDALAAGHVITHDWTRTAVFGPDGHPLSMDEGALSAEQAWQYAHDDLQHGVGEAQAVVFLADEGNFCGALIEYGYALARSVPVLLVAPWRPSIFWHSPRTTLLPDENAARDLLGMRLLPELAEAVA
jgi:hypothetical protein